MHPVCAIMLQQFAHTCPHLSLQGCQYTRHAGCTQVLLDNVNSAPPELLERLNSLMEDEPTLHVYEHAEGEVLSYSDGSIHPDFRLIATADMRRPGAYRLSSATLNRVICLHMPALDQGGLSPSSMLANTHMAWVALARGAAPLSFRVLDPY